MKLTWFDLHKKYSISDERYPLSKRDISLGRIKELINKDEDYFLCLRNRKRGEIYRHKGDGSLWAVYIRPSKTWKKQKTIWGQIDKMGLELKQENDVEAVWVFSSNVFDQVASILKIRKKKVK